MKTKIQFNYLWRPLLSLFQTYILRKEIGRQRFFIANISNPHNIYKALITIGFQPNYFAFHDKGELYNLRRLKYNSDNELWQEHIRIFPDEMRGHWEITYEEDAIKHYKGTTVVMLPKDALEEVEGVAKSK